MTAIDRARAEPFGAWVRLDDGSLIAIDRARAKAIGVDGEALWNGPNDGLLSDPVAPLEVHVAVTARCPASCTGCYLDARADGEHASVESIEATLQAARARGVFTVAFGGGEPLTHPAIGDLARRARALGLTPVVTTSGIGMTRDKARALTAFAQVNVSYDGAGDGYVEVRGFDGRPAAERAIGWLHDAGIAVGVNVVLTRPSFGAQGDAIVDTCARARSLGAREAQLLRYKPAGRAASLDYLAQRLSPAQIESLPSALGRIAALATAEAPFGLRVDCAMVSLLSTTFDDVAPLHALGVFGCEAGRALEAVKVDGRAAPCSFLPSMGDTADAADARGTSMRAFIDYPRTAPEPCASCPIRSVCRGGCRVVAAHLGDSHFAPDPECPRVRAHEATRRLQ